MAARISSGQSEDFVDELILTLHQLRSSIEPALAKHVDRFITLNCSPHRMELSDSLLDIDSSFDGVVVLLNGLTRISHQLLAEGRPSWHN